MTDVPAAKAALRADVRALRLRDLPEMTAARNLRVLELAEVREALSVALFVSISDEPSTGALRESLTDRDVEVLLPVLRDDLFLDWARDRGSLEVGHLGLLHPGGPHIALEEADVVIVPAVAVDAVGRRLGRGGGSYDRAIMEYRQRRPSGMVVALAFDQAIVEVVPTDPHDQPVDALVTEARTARFAPDR